LFGKVLENGFYLVTMLIGMSTWTYNNVQSRKMDKFDYMLFTIVFLPLAFAMSYMIVTNYNYDQIWLDTITTTIGVIAQLMLVLRFREQWVLWFILDVLCVVLWAIDGNWCLSMQYVFWTINCIYGFVCWKPNLSEHPEQSTTN
jgi:nicotinamide mononucleotide transporter